MEKPIRVGYYAGSFDPFTFGHMDVVNEALKIFDKVVIVIAKNPNKGKGFMTPYVREQSLTDLYKLEIYQGTVEVVTLSENELLVDFVHRHDYNMDEEVAYSALVRGIRGVDDFLHESDLANTNYHISKTDIQTVLLPTKHYLQHVSSSLVRTLHSTGGDIRPYVPTEVLLRIRG